jgi:hypothetical protein
MLYRSDALSGLSQEVTGQNDIKLDQIIDALKYQKMSDRGNLRVAKNFLTLLHVYQGYKEFSYHSGRPGAEDQATAVLGRFIRALGSFVEKDLYNPRLDTLGLKRRVQLLGEEIQGDTTGLGIFGLGTQDFLTRLGRILEGHFGADFEKSLWANESLHWQRLVNKFSPKKVSKSMVKMLVGFPLPDQYKNL